MKINKWLFLFVILISIVSVSALLTIIYNQKDIIPAVNRPANTSFESDESMKYSGRWFRDELHLTSDQMREFSGFNPAFRQKIRSINIEMNTLKEMMLEEMNSASSDTARLNSLSDSIGELHAGLKKVTWAYYLELKRICNGEQQVKLKQIFAGMFEGTMPAVGPGRGMQGGRRSGMQRSNN